MCVCVCVCVSKMMKLPGYITSLTSFPPIPLAIEILLEVNLYRTHACLASAETKGIIPSTVIIESAGMITSLAAGGPSKKIVSIQHIERKKQEQIRSKVYKKPQVK